MHEKDFEKWNTEKQKIEKHERQVFLKEREIWWCSFGVNIGAEMIIKIISKETVLVLPLTTKERKDKNHFTIKTDKIESWAKLSQPRVVSIKRLSRKVGVVDKAQFFILKEAFIDYLR
jgi:mRNA-degrading endonuclease toxin of MazEF toxin-antitoxin module